MSEKMMDIRPMTLEEDIVRPAPLAEAHVMERLEGLMGHRSD